VNKETNMRNLFKKRMQCRFLITEQKTGRYIGQLTKAHCAVKRWSLVIWVLFLTTSCLFLPPIG